MLKRTPARLGDRFWILQGSTTRAPKSLHEPDTGRVRRYTTTSVGTYSFASLVLAYLVAVEASGFKKFVKKDVIVVADQDNLGDAQTRTWLAAGETIEVVAGACVRVQTTDSTLTTIFDAKECRLPQRRRATQTAVLINLAVLAPNVLLKPGGVTGVGGSVGGTPPRDNQSSLSTEWTTTTWASLEINSTVIPMRAGGIALKTNQFSAEYGHSAGGHSSSSPKTGDEQLARNR